MGTEPTSNANSNSNSNSNQSTPQKNNLYEGLGEVRQKPYRHRLYSDPQDMPQDNEKLPPIRRHSNINVGNLQSNLSNNLNNSNNTNQNENQVNPHFQRSDKRRMSQQYYAHFKNTHSGNADYIYLNIYSIGDMLIILKQEENAGNLLVKLKIAKVILIKLED